MNERELALMAQHIAQFSLGGVRAISERSGGSLDLPSKRSGT
jgi:hypothetical protein